MMDQVQGDNQTRQHLWMSALGALAGLSIWVLFEYLPDTIENERLLLWMASATVGFFILSFAFLGSLRWQIAFGASALFSLADASLLLWTSERFDRVDDLIDHSYVLLSWGMILFLGAPFVAAGIQRRIRDYAFLFDTSWNIVVRYIAAWIFVGVFWALLMLSDELLGIVGVTIIEDLLDIDPVPYVLTGLTLGIAVSVAQDLNAYISPYLPLRLLRLLLPMVLLVVSVFIIALPLRGLSQLFGSFSAAATLMSVAIIAIFLISSALDRVDSDGVQSRFMRLMTKALAFLLPILSGLAVWAIWLRVSDYGWTPERIAASLAALLILAYGVSYGVAIFQGRAWGRMIRQANIGLAATVILLAALWMTPLMNAQRLSAEAQMTRYLQGLLEAKDIPAWELQHEWGRAGSDMVQALRTMDAEQHADLHARLDRANELSKWEFNRSDDSPTTEEMALIVLDNTEVWPEGRKVSEEFFSEVGRYWLEKWSKACVADKARPCVMIYGPFGVQGVETTVLLVPESETGAIVYHGAEEGGELEVVSDLRFSLSNDVLDEAAYQQVRAGGYRIGPSRRQSLWIGEIELDREN